MTTSSEVHGYSLSAASLRGERVVVFGVVKNIILAINDGTDEHAFVVNDDQVVRDVALLETPGGACCVVSGGDGKRINVYNVPSVQGTKDQSIQHNGTHTGTLALAFSFGPHSKRITHVATSDDATILFADKFGEVFRLGFLWGPNQNIMAAGGEVAPVFLLQHFSVMSTFFLSAPLRQPKCGQDSLQTASTRAGLAASRRLFTFDKDRHARVSCYPETFRIQQYLWTDAPQSVVTSITEIPDTAESGRYSYFVVGCHNGTVHLWVADNMAPSECIADPFTLIGSIVAQKSVPKGDEEVSAVVSVVCLTSSSPGSDSRVDESHSRGILITCANTMDVIFVPLRKSDDNHKLLFCADGATRTRLESFPVAMVGYSTDSALVLQRSGRVQVLQLTHGDGPVVAHLAEAQHAPLEKAIGGLLQGPLRTLLSEMDLFAQWNYDAVDPRARKKNTRASSEDCDEEGEAEECETAMATQSGSSSSKKTRTEHSGVV
ncbi:hypothetical protein DQ04_00121260 [Trypanosoma grayi]|uniref:hypothetical protein n=1 Tax=Trypanosoma grayi TaxID=71804 RepID=UPI0004F402F3|nr:hypothetical protein DQ04_00121260 [Trypanosoma grayi]KEG15294.1 hypothetical protein DQ04_00121260 [Trypanosoma grayi]